MKFQPPELPTNRTSEQWSWLKKLFTDGLVINKIREDAHQLTFLRSYAGPELFSILDGATLFTNGLAKLDRQFQKPTRVMYARHHLLSSKQRDDESEFSFFKRLQLLVENLNIATLRSKSTMTYYYVTAWYQVYEAILSERGYRS